MKTERKRLTPKPHILKSIRARNWTLAGAIEELVDNGASHGRADKIEVVIDNAAGIGVFDNGKGIDDINRIFEYGNASSYDDLSEIGQYGVGAKHAAIWLGNITTVETVYNGRHHEMTVDWSSVDRNAEWPWEYQGDGRKAKTDEKGTRITINELTRHYQLSTSEKMTREFGQIFAPALRRGTKIIVYHRLANGQTQILKAEPFTPSDLTDETMISGEVSTRHGTLRWKGRAGLSASLVERFNGVHIAFGHRVIEVTRDPFKGKSAPTVYVEVQLDETTDWKHQLSDHKDAVVRYRDELIDSIHATIKALLERSERQAQNLALNAMISPIETALNKALKGAGLLHFDPEEEPSFGGNYGDETEPVENGSRLRTPTLEGEQGKEVKRPTGIKFDWRDAAFLQGRAYCWEISGATMTILLDKEIFKPIIEWPPRARDKHVVHLIVGFVSHAIEMEFWDNERNLRGVITTKLIKCLGDWANEPSKIAPYLYRELINSARLPA